MGVDEVHLYDLYIPLTEGVTREIAYSDAADLIEAALGRPVNHALYRDKPMLQFQAIADANGGVRAAGTPGYDASVDYVAETLEAAGHHKGSAFTEILQNCNIFNDGAWRDFTDRDVRADRTLELKHGEMAWVDRRQHGSAERGQLSPPDDGVDVS